VQVSEERDSEFVSRRTETSYKAESLGKAAQHVNARGTGDTVNGALGVSSLAYLHKGSSRSYTPQGGELSPGRPVSPAA